MKRNKFINFILSLEEEVVIGSVSVRKKFVLIGIMAIIIYFLIMLYNTNSSGTMRAGDKRNPKYTEVKTEEQKALEEELNKTFVEKPEQIITYEQRLNDILTMSNEEIRTLLREQNMYLSDEDITLFKEEARKNMPKTEAEVWQQAEEYKKFEEENMKKIYEEAQKMTEKQKIENQK